MRKLETLITQNGLGIPTVQWVRKVHLIVPVPLNSSCFSHNFEINTASFDEPLVDILGTQWQAFKLYLRH